MAGALPAGGTSRAAGRAPLAVFGRSLASPVRRRGPVLYAEAVAVGSWLALVVNFAAVGRAAPTFASHSGPAGDAMSGMPGMAPSAGAPVSSAVAAGLPMWALMSAAMMLPAAIPAVRHVAANSLRWRRRRAVVEFVGVFLGLWIAFGGIVLAVLSIDPALVGSPLAVPVGLGAATAWQLTPAKRRALGGCHTSWPLPPTGWRASAGVARFGLRYAGSCVGSCWAMMVVMTLATSFGLLWTALLTAVISTEKLARRPRRVTRAAAGAFALAALAAAIPAIA